MIYLISAIAFSTSIVITFRLFTRFKIDNLQAITTNYLTGALLAFLFYTEAYSLTGMIQSSWFVFALAVGVAYITVFLLFALSSQKAGVAVTAVTSKMSVVIPVSVGILAYGEALNFIKIAGILASLLAFYLTFKQKKSQQIDKKVLMLPVLLFLASGLNDTLSKHAQSFHVGEQTLLFLGMVFVSSLFIGLFLLGRKQIRGELRLHPASHLAGIWLGLLNFFSSYFFLLGLKVFESSVFFPVFNVSIVSLAAVAGFVFFKERLSWINWTGILLAVMAILLIAAGS